MKQRNKAFANYLIGSIFGLAIGALWLNGQIVPALVFTMASTIYAAVEFFL